MDLQYFFKILLRRKWLLLLAMIIAVALAWILVGLQETTYKSKSIIGTGIIDQRSINLEQDNPFIQKFIVESKFSILTELFQNRNSIRLLTYRLLQHDLGAELAGETPYRVPKVDEDEPLEHTGDEIIEFTETLLAIPSDSAVFYIFRGKEREIFDDLAKAYEYDYKSLTENLSVQRIGDTDYVSIEFESENAELSAFVVNKFIEDFINSNDNVANSDKLRTVNFYVQLAEDKKEELDELNRRITNFKQNRSIIDLEEQSKTTIGQIKDLELAREESQKNINGLERSIVGYNKYIDKDNLTVANEYGKDIFLNGDVKDLKNQIDELNDQWVSGGMKNDGLKTRIDKRKQQYYAKVKEVANENTLSSRKDKERTPETVLSKRIDAEAELAIAEEGVKSISTEIARLRKKAGSFVSADAFLEALDGEKEIVLNEYLNVTEKLNEAQRITQTYTSPLSVIEYGEKPEKPEPSGRMIISAFAGVAAVSLCTLFIFLLTLFDNSLNTPAKFEQFAQVPLLGSLNKIKSKRLDFQELFDGNQKDKRLVNFKESLRKIRYAIENSGANSFLFTSTKEQEGKTFALIALAYSLSMNNKKVLVIDTNFKNNTLTDMSNKTLANNPLSEGLISETGNSKPSKALKTQITINNNVDIIGNKGGNHSPSEILAGKNFRRVLEGFSTKYDYIFLESAALNDFADTRELAPYVDKVVAVFDASQSLNSTDKESIEFLKNLNGKFMGGVLNNIDLKNLN
ncbi:MAG: GumC family protein [Saprospiraceae bacterium]